MLILGLYLFIALFFSFLCSIAEAVLLSVSWVHISVIEQEGEKSGRRLRKLKQDINRPLSAILTLNTVAHTVGAAGVGAQASVVFGDAYLGVVSAVLTLLILIFSEIIPKTLGASYWKQLAPVTAYCLTGMVFLFAPFIKMSELITRKMVKESSASFNRNELAMMAQLSAKEGVLGKEEAAIVQNLLLLQEHKIKMIMTPRTVVFSVAQQLTVAEFYHKHSKNRFSRIPVYDKDPDNIVGFVLRNELLLAHARNNKYLPLSHYVREMPTFLEDMSLLHAMKEILLSNSHVSLIVNEYGTVRGILALEDILETLIGHEIIDEGDKDIDMQKLAKRLWKHKAKKYGIDVEQSKDS